MTLCCLKVEASLSTLSASHSTLSVSFEVSHFTYSTITLNCTPISEPATLERELRYLFYFLYFLVLLTGWHSGHVTYFTELLILLKYLLTGGHRGPLHARL